MTAYLRSLRAAAVTPCAALIALSAFVLSTEAQEKSLSVLTGRLATVESDVGRVSLLPEGEVQLVELFAAADCQVNEAERRLTLAELVIYVGRRVTIHFDVEGDRRLARRIIVEPEG